MEADLPATRLIPALLLVLFSGCATPVPPSGGDRDDTPPRVVETSPERGAVQVRPERVRVRFNEYINQRTAGNAVTVTPQPGLPPEVRTDGKSLDVVFREPLRDNTTYIVTIDTGLQDANGVALKSPVRVAFATGPQINRGRLQGRVLRSEDGAEEAGIDIYAYLRPAGAAPLQLPGPDDTPDYRTQTDESGAFSFDYLQEAPFFVLGVSDANRNRIADAGERLAWPPLETVRADSAGSVAGTWLSAAVDTTSPSLRRARALSQRRVELLFDEPLAQLITVADSWSLADSSSGAPLDLQSVYRSPGDPRALIMSTRDPFGSTLRVAGTDIATDSSGNRLSLSDVFVRPTSRPDTLRARFVGFELDTLTVVDGFRVLKPQRDVTLQFTSAPVALREAIQVTDTAGVALEWETTTRDGTSMEVQVVASGGFRISVDLARFAGPDSVASVLATYPNPRLLGELTGFVSRRGTQGTIRVQLEQPIGTPVLQTVADSTGLFLFRGLPGGQRYAVRLVEDLDTNLRWDFGRLAPFSRPEQLGWFAETPATRARWETVIPDTLRIAPLLPAPRPSAGASPEGIPPDDAEAAADTTGGRLP